jgi:hypothetical protein
LVAEPGRLFAGGAWSASRTADALGLTSPHLGDGFVGRPLALAVEEQALSAAAGTILASLPMRYLPPVRVGPALASADVGGAVGRVEVQDAGSDGCLAVAATTRAFGDHG